MQLQTALKAEVITPMSKNDAADVKVEHIPLPPKEMWAELDNSVEQSAAPVERKTVSPAARPIERLAFAEPPRVTVPLQYPFNHPVLGYVTTIHVHRLTVGEVGELLDARQNSPSPDNFDIYAAQTGIPAPILRGLIDVDGEEVADKCYDFLPRVFRPTTPASQSPLPGGDR